ncbi:MAG: glycyl-radical enzyme activating protein [Anaerolineae bacterium]|jgi:pyruvate formate lyase activating enzyme|nr:MAG: glycyl-radical enzyme activating protein [Anaerolineae bacterium]
METLELSGILFDIRRYSVHDGPGIRTTVFFKGCPLNCWWCHNPEGKSPEIEIFLRENRCIRCGACLNVCEVGAIYQHHESFETNRALCTLCGACVEECYAEARELVGKRMTVSEVLEEIERDRAFFEQSGGGVTFSGGEPLFQPNFLAALLQACRSQGIHTAVDTCGFASWDTLNRLRTDIDLFLYDLKLIDEERHRQFTGVSNLPILENLRRLSAFGHSIFVRFPIIPQINDDAINLRQMVEFLLSLPQKHPLDLLPYHASALHKYNGLGVEYRLRETPTPEQEHLNEIKNYFESYGFNVRIGG